MNTFIIFFLLSFFFAASLSRSINGEELENIATQMEENYKNDVKLLGKLFVELEAIKSPKDQMLVAKSRGRRGIRVCGKSILTFTLKVCGEIGTESTDIDIATKCCNYSECSEEFIRKSVCPSKQ